MSDIFFYFLLVLLLLAITLREDFILTLLYLLIGAYVFGRTWGLRGLKNARVRRDFPRRAFLGEKINIDVEITNTSWLPLAWLQVREQLPVALHSLGPIHEVTTLGPKGKTRVKYNLECRRRGYYPIGPLDLFSSDVLGMAEIQRLRFPEEYLTVYPRIVPLTQVRMPSHSPLGTLRHNQPVFEDPSRVRGKRDYVAGDSLRRVDWKASAATGRLQVKLFEPSIALETMLFLNLNAEEYPPRRLYDVSELSIVVAASLANWIVGVRQAVGLATNGIDPMIEGAVTGQALTVGGVEGSPPPLPPGRGRGHLLRLLETLARIQVGESSPYARLLQMGMRGLSWGTTLIMVTCHIDDKLFDGLFQARRSGLNALMVQCGPTRNYQEIRRRADHFGFPIFQVLNEDDLEVWRL